MRVENVKGAVWTVDEVEFYKRRPQRACSTTGYVAPPHAPSIRKKYNYNRAFYSLYIFSLSLSFYLYYTNLSISLLETDGLKPSLSSIKGIVSFRLQISLRFHCLPHLPFIYLYYSLSIFFCLFTYTYIYIYSLIRFYSSYIYNRIANPQPLILPPIFLQFYIIFI